MSALSTAIFYDIENLFKGYSSDSWSDASASVAS
jgi:hypothetical protein